jgi:hypothetical protein
LEFAGDEVGDSDHLVLAAVAAGAGFDSVDERVGGFEQPVGYMAFVPGDDAIPVPSANYLIGCRRKRLVSVSCQLCKPRIGKISRRGIHAAGKELSVSQDTNLDDREAEASARLASVFDASMIDALMTDAMASGTPIEGVDGLVNTMTKAVLKRALEVEMTHEPGYGREDPAGAGSGNSRHGHLTKTVSASNGPVTMHMPRDRNGVFSNPRIVPKHARRLGQINEMILSWYACSMTTRDIEAHLHGCMG